jgi:hypothetical protein
MTKGCCGKYKPEEGMAQNRRIEITLMPNMAELPDLSSLRNLL